MTTININSTSYLKHDGLQYLPYYFQAGGDVVKNTKTGEMREKEDKWVHTGTYHRELSQAVRKLAEINVLSKEEYKSLQEYVEAFNNAYLELDELVAG